MKEVIKIVFGIINLFLGALVAYKIYGYFSPHVGFDLPELTYLNVLAVAFILSAFFAPLETILKLQTIQDKVMGDEKPTPPIVFIKTMVLLIMWLLNYIFYIILF